MDKMNGKIGSFFADSYREGNWSSTSVTLPEELSLTVYINGIALVDILCTPKKLNCLVLGFLYNEGIISGLGEVLMIRVCEDDGLADVKLKNSDFKVPERRILTSGCGGGLSLTDKGKNVLSEVVYEPHEILSLMKKFRDGIDKIKETGGIHVSALGYKEKIVVMSEDIGRHNTIDKIQGECLLSGIKAKDGVLLTTGRISSEMIIKASMMEVPVLVSLRTPTAKAVYLARDLGICVIAHARANHFTVYSNPSRISSSPRECH